MDPHRLYKLCLVIILIVSYPGFTLAQSMPTEKLTLRDALHLTLERDVRMIVADERVKQALARIEQSRSSLLPTLSGEISENRQTRDLRSTGFMFPGSPLVGPFNVFEARIKLTQTLFDPAALSRLRASQAGHIVSLAEREMIRQDMLVFVANLFINTRRSQENLKIADAELRLQKKNMTITYKRYQSGISSLLDFRNARSRYALAISLWQDAKSKDLQNHLDLAATLSLPAGNNLELLWDPQMTETLNLHNVDWDTQPDVALANENFRLSQALNTTTKNDIWPKISINGDFSQSGSSPNTKDSSETYTLGVKATFPLFEGRIREFKIKENESRILEKKAILADTKRSIQFKIIQNDQDIRQAKAFLSHKSMEVASAQLQWQLAQQRYRKGFGNNLELTIAKVTLSQAINEKDEAMAYYFLAKVKQARAQGQVENLLLDQP